MASTLDNFDDQIKQVAVDVQLRTPPTKSDNLYRDSVEITNSGGALTDELIKINIDHHQLCSLGKSSYEFNDLRVYDGDLVTELDFWVDSPGQPWTNIFVKIPSIGASSTKTIYIEYGNQTLVNKSNLSNTIDSVLSGSQCVHWLKASELNKHDKYLEGPVTGKDIVKIDDHAKIGYVWAVPQMKLSYPQLILDEEHRPAIYFDGSSVLEQAFTPENLVFQSSDFEVFSVIKPAHTTNVTPENVFFGQLRAVGSAGNYDAIHMYFNTSSVRGGLYYDTVDYTIPGYKPGTLYNVNLVHDSDNDAGYGVARQTLNLNGSVVATDSVVRQLAFTNRSVLGARGTYGAMTDYYLGNIYEILVFSSNLNATQRAKIQKFLDLKYNQSNTTSNSGLLGETNITITKTYVSYYPFVVSVDLSKRLSENWHGVETVTSKIRIDNLFNQTLLVGSDIESWTNSTLDKTGNLVGQYCRSLTVGTVGITDSAEFIRDVAGNNYHDISKFEITNQLIPTTYNSTDDDFICLEISLDDHTLLDKTNSYLQFSNSAGTQTKTGYLLNNVNSLASNEPTTIKIRKSDFVDSGGGSWGDVSHTFNLFLQTTSGTVNALHSWLRLQIDHTRLFTPGSQVRILTNVSDDLNLSWAESNIYEGFIDSVDSTTEDWSFNVLDSLQGFLNQEVKDLPSYDQGPLILSSSSKIPYKSFNGYKTTSLKKDYTNLLDNYNLSKIRISNGTDLAWVLGANTELVSEVEDPDGVKSGTAYSFKYNNGVNAEIISDPLYGLGSGNTIDLTFSIWIKIESGTLSGYDKIGFNFYDSNGVLLESVDSPNLAITGAWQKFTLVAEQGFDFNYNYFRLKLPSNINGAVLSLAWPELLRNQHGLLKSGLEFNGSNTYLNVAHDPTLDFFGTGGEASFLAWVSVDSLSNIRTLFSKRTTTGWQVAINTDGRTFITNLTATYFSTSTVPLNIWTHVAITIDTANNVKIYFNGVLDSATTGTTFNNNSVPMTIGIQNSPLIRAMDGLLSSLAIFNKALSISDIAFYKDIVLSGSEAGLVYYEPLLHSELSNTPTDRTGNHTSSFVNFQLPRAKTDRTGQSLINRDLISLNERAVNRTSTKHITSLVKKVDSEAKIIDFYEDFLNESQTGNVLVANNNSFKKTIQNALVNSFGVLAKNNKNQYILRDVSTYIFNLQDNLPHIKREFIYEYKTVTSDYKPISVITVVGSNTAQIHSSLRSSNSILNKSAIGENVPANSSIQYTIGNDEFSPGVFDIVGYKAKIIPLDQKPLVYSTYTQSMSSVSLTASNFTLRSLRVSPKNEIVFDIQNNNINDYFLYDLEVLSDSIVLFDGANENYKLVDTISDVEVYEASYTSKKAQKVGDLINAITLNNEFSSGYHDTWSNTKLQTVLDKFKQLSFIEFVVDYRVDIEIGQLYTIVDDNYRTVTVLIVGKEFNYSEQKHENKVTAVALD